jgi:uncharacterized membrane protein YidH (DUF202 family)
VTQGFDPAAIVEDEELPGLASERTDLAWTRIGISVLTVVATILKRVVRGFDLESASSIVFAIVISGAVAWTAIYVYAEALSETAHPERNLTNPERLRNVALGTTLFALAAAALALLP